MKTTTLRWLAVCAAVAAAVLCWFLLRTDPEPGPGPGAKVPVSAPRMRDKPVVSSPPPEPWPEFGTPEFKRMALERGRKWLEYRGRDAASLIAAWDITGEESLLMEAAEKFPNDPRVCLAMILHTKDDGQKTMPWIERLIAAEPNNSEGYFLKAGALMRDKDRAGALAALRKAVAAGGSLDDHLRERILTVREAALASGASVREAAQLALAAPLMNSTVSQSLGGTGRFVRDEMKDAKAAGNEERMLEIAGLGLATVDRVSKSSAATLMDALIAGTFERAILAELSDDIEIGANGRTVAQMKEEAAARHSQMQQFLKQAETAEKLLRESSDSVVSEYTDRFLLNGEVAAWTWLINQAVPTKPAEEAGK